MIYAVHMQYRWIMNDTKHMEISELIEERIRQGVYAGKLPPVRKLSDDLSISTRTLNKALKPLVARGLLIPDGPRGIIIQSGTVPRKKTGIVGVFSSGRSVFSKDNVLINSLKNLMERDNFRILLMCMLDDELYADPKFWSSNWLDGYIFIYSSFNKKLASEMRKNNIPFVAANRIPPEYGINCVDFDHAGALRKGVDYLYRRGCRNIAIDFSFATMKEYRDYIGKEALKILKEYGVSSKANLLIDDRHTPDYPERHAEYFLGLKKVPDGILLNMPIAARVERILNSAGHYPVIIETDPKEPAPYPCFRKSYEKLAESVWARFLKVYNEPAAETASETVEIKFTTYGADK